MGWRWALACAASAADPAAAAAQRQSNTGQVSVTQTPGLTGQWGQRILGVIGILWIEGLRLKGLSVSWGSAMYEGWVALGSPHAPHLLPHPAALPLFASAGWVVPSGSSKLLCRDRDRDASPSPAPPPPSPSSSASPSSPSLRSKAEKE